MSDEILNQLLQGQGRIEAKIDLTLDRVNKHDDKISALEKAQARRTGFAAAIGTIGSILGAAGAIAADFFSKRH